jgi:glycosyltransferase involved in cell wall biosynthesis
LNTWHLPQDTRLFLFNGTLNYLPNTEALHVIVKELLPLLKQKNLLFRIIVCGKGLDARWQEVLQAQPEIIYTGFVPDIRLYFMGADCLINPITLGGGIRTKMIEALAHQQTVISVTGSAHGLSPGAGGDKLIVVADDDWQAFADAMAQPDLHTENRVPETFQADHDWRNIVQKALLSLQTL